MVHVMLRASARREVSSDLFAPGFFVPKLSVTAARIARIDPTIAIEVPVASAARACGAPTSTIVVIVDIVIIVSQHRRAKREPCNKCCDPPTSHNFLLLQAWPERTAQRLRFLRDATPRCGIHRRLKQFALRDVTPEEFPGMANHVAPSCAAKSRSQRLRLDLCSLERQGLFGDSPLMAVWLRRCAL